MRRTLVLFLALGFVGCAVISPEWQKVSVRATVIDPDYTVLESFTNGGYNEQGLLIRVSEPEEMKDEVIAVPVTASFGSKVTLSGDPSAWQKPVGSALEFEVRRRDVLDAGQ